MIRLYVPLPDGARDEVTLTDERFHYLIRVLRLEVGAALEIFDGRGHRFAARLLHTTEGSATVTLGAPRTEELARSVTLVQGLPKGDKFEWVLQKGTELGASAFLPVDTERAVRKLEGKRAQVQEERWQKIVEEAARQCGRSDVPQMFTLCPLREMRSVLPPGTEVLVLDTAEDVLPLSQALAVQGTAPLALVMGPEGGLSRSEVDGLRAEGATGVTLGRRILRTETAALAALTVLRHLEGTLG